MSTPFDINNAKYLIEELKMEKIKIASGEIINHELLYQLGKYKKPIILSTGMSDISEIEYALDVISCSMFNVDFKEGYFTKLSKEKRIEISKYIILMHCISEYPAPYNEINLNSIKYLKDKFKLTTGYSNHVIGINACLTSICMGARVIEFHFTDNKKRKFRDHMLSLDKYDVRKLINTGNNFNLLFGKYQKKVDNNLRKIKNILLKGIIVNKNLYKNQKIKIKDLTYARPAKFYNAGEINKIVGKKLKKNIKKGYLVRKSHF